MEVNGYQQLLVTHIVKKIFFRVQQKEENSNRFGTELSFLG